MSIPQKTVDDFLVDFSHSKMPDNSEVNHSVIIYHRFFERIFPPLTRTEYRYPLFRVVRWQFGVLLLGYLLYATAVALSAVFLYDKVGSLFQSGLNPYVLWYSCSALFCSTIIWFQRFHVRAFVLASNEKPETVKDDLQKERILTLFERFLKIIRYLAIVLFLLMLNHAIYTPLLEATFLRPDQSAQAVFIGLIVFAIHCVILPVVPTLILFYIYTCWIYEKKLKNIVDFVHHVNEKEVVTKDDLVAIRNQMGNLAKRIEHFGMIFNPLIGFLFPALFTDSILDQLRYSVAPANTLSPWMRFELLAISPACLYFLLKTAQRINEKMKVPLKYFIDIGYKTFPEDLEYSLTYHVSLALNQFINTILRTW